eukprot:PITA_03186
MEYTKNRVPLFNGNNYALWCGRIQVQLLAQGYEVWEIVDKGFTLTQDEQARFNAKVSVLEDRSNLTNLSIDESHRILTAYEMRIEEEDGTFHLETAFAASKKNSKDKQTLKEKTCNYKDKEKEEDEEEFSDKEFAYFTWKMRTGTRKFKGKLLLICFDCGEVGHFAAKCPHKNEVVMKGKKSPRKFNNQGKKQWFKKSFFSKEDSSSSEEDSDNEEEFNGRVLFMAKHNKQEEPDEEGDEEEEMTKVEFQNEVIRVIKDLKAEKKHVNTLEDELKIEREQVLNLKIKVEEYKQIEKSLRKELKETNKEREALEAEIISLRKEVKKGKTFQNYANSSKNLDELINNQRSCNDKTGLGYKEKIEKESSPSMTTKEDGYPKSTKQVDLPARSRDQDSQEEPWKTIPRRRFPSRYQPIFYGHYYSCGRFGHRAAECRMYVWNEYNSMRSLRNGYSITQQNINRFDHLRHDVECYKCNNFGHLTKDRRLGSSSKEFSQNRNEQVWKRKTKRCALALKAQSNRNAWYVDSGCSTHMTRDRNKFISLKKNKDGTVSFGNDGSSNVIGASTVTLGRKDALAKDVLLVENMNHNLPSVGQMCDQGHTMLFNSKKCEIRKGKFGKIVATASRAPNDIYNLDETPKGCFLANEDES